MVLIDSVFAGLRCFRTFLDNPVLFRQFDLSVIVQFDWCLVLTPVATAVNACVSFCFPITTPMAIADPRDTNLLIILL